MTDIDKKIREALNREDAELLGGIQSDPALHELLIEAFRGKHRWLNAMASVMTLIGVVLALFAGYSFFQSVSTRSMIAWATAFLWLNLAVAMLKMWMWMELQRLPVMREIKRLELKIVQLSHELQPEPKVRSSD
jgi:hypothetical protein